jgi:tetratricopeptide (TPR) repeat protein
MPKPLRVKLAIVFSAVTLASLLLNGAARAQRPTQPPVAANDNEAQAKAALNQGVAAFENAQFDQAVQFFKRAKELNPNSLNARLYLATAYASQYIPGAPSEENQQMGKLATEGYRDALLIDPQNLPAIDGLASILYQRAGTPFSPELFEESKSLHQKHTEISPNDPQPYYSIGVIDWALVFRANTQIRQEFNRSVNGEALKDTDPLPEGLRIDYVEKYGPMVDEGMEALRRALALKPNYDDAMVYLNLLYRRKADMVANVDERDKLIEEADALLDKVKDIKQESAKSPQGQLPN